tara:strand:+ start:284 stop:673 length:390 start_codon:yes stop_codon:yes gene_type:complete
MKYSYSKDINVSFDKAEKNVVNALMDVGFGVLTEVNIQGAFKSKLNINYKKYKILGACNPNLAHEALEYDPLIGILMPCNIVIIDNEDGTTKVVFPNAKNLLEITENKKIDTLSEKVDILLESAFKSLT